MSARLRRDQEWVAKYMPKNTWFAKVDERDVWVFQKMTEVGVGFEIAIYFDPTESAPGYVAQVRSPPIENAWKSPHVGHIFSDGVICFGGPSSRTRTTMADAYAKACLWAEGMGIMIAAKAIGTPTAFPFSTNNSEEEVR